MPRMVLSVGTLFNRRYSNVVESSDIPLLPVSRIKLSVSGRSPTRACINTMPPVSCVNGTVVRYLDGGGINSSCADTPFITSRARDNVYIYIMFFRMRDGGLYYYDN